MSPMTHFVALANYRRQNDMQTNVFYEMSHKTLSNKIHALHFQCCSITNKGECDRKLRPNITFYPL